MASELEGLPAFASCIVRVGTWLFGGTFLAAGLYLWLGADGPHRAVEVALGLLTVLTGLTVVVPWGLGYESAGKALSILWLICMVLFLLAMVVARALGLV